MSTYTVPRRIRLDALGFPASAVEVDGSTTVTADVAQGVLQAAVDAAPTATDPATITANAATITTRATQALATNATFLALGSPTNAQTLAQVRALTRECSGLIRLLLGTPTDTTNT